MLTLTENASMAVKSIVGQVPDAPDGGLRIRDTGSAETGFELGIAPQPESTDAVVETEGARVFLDAGAALVLDDKVLDAQMEQDGSVRFALAGQPPA